MLEELDAIETQMKEQQRITRQLLMVAHVNPKDDLFYNRFNMKVTLPLTYSREVGLSGRSSCKSREAGAI